MKLTKRDRHALEGVLYDIERARDYILQPDLMLTRRRRVATTTEDYTNAKGEVCCEVEKAYGSNLVGLYRGAATLRAMLEAPCSQ